MTIFDSSSSSLTSTEQVGHLQYGILTHTATFSGYYYIKLEAISGWGKDDSYYRLYIDIETNNIVSLADSITLGDQFEDYVCARDCHLSSNNPTLYKDPIDWYKVDIPAGITSWGLERRQGRHIHDMSMLMCMKLEGEVLFTSSAGNRRRSGQSMTSIRQLGVTQLRPKHTTFRVTASTTQQGNYGTDYTLAISSGKWYTVKEDDSSDPTSGFTYITINDVRPGETISAHAIRTEIPNDLDILLYNESEFEVYKECIRNGCLGQSPQGAPSELLEKQDCWVCSIELELSDVDVGLTSVNPGRSANRSTELSWTPTFYLVADYTDYLKYPPLNRYQDISHVFLSLDVDRGVRTNQYYTVESWDSSSSNWQFVRSGSTTSGSLSAPSSGWDASENETTHFSYTDYRVTARNASTTGTIVSQSQFRAINMAPVACFDAKGVDNLVATIHVPVTFDSECSSDPDSMYSTASVTQDITSTTWYIDGVSYSAGSLTGVFTQTDTIDVSLEVEDDQGLVRWKNQTISIVDFPVSDFTTVSNISGQSTIRLDTNYTVNETLTWRPNWADAEVANKVIGVGLAFNFKRTHIGYVDVEIDPSSNGQFVGLDADVSASTNRYIMELKPEVQFYWYDVENSSDGGNFSFPVPSLIERYNNQRSENLTLNGSNVEIFLWDEFDEIYNGTTLTDQYGQTMSVYENITISAIDLYPLITKIMSYNSVTGAVSAFVNSFVDIDILLEFGIMLEVTMENELWMHATTQGTFYDYDDTTSVLQFDGFQTSAHDYFTDSNSNGDVLNTTNVTGDVAFSLYPFYNWESETEVYGFVNLTITIARKVLVDFNSIVVYGRSRFIGPVLELQTV